MLFSNSKRQSSLHIAIVFFSMVWRVLTLESNYDVKVTSLYFERLFPICLIYVCNDVFCDEIYRRTGKRTPYYAPQSCCCSRRWWRYCQKLMCHKAADPPIPSNVRKFEFVLDPWRVHTLWTVTKCEQFSRGTGAVIIFSTWNSV